MGAIDDVRLARRLVQTGAARQLREGAGLSRQEASLAAGAVSAAAVKAYELHRRRPTGRAGSAYGLLRQLLGEQ